MRLRIYLWVRGGLRVPRIVFATTGSLGDLHPCLALGTELRRRGHGVAIATAAWYREKIEACGLEYRPMRPH